MWQFLRMVFQRLFLLKHISKASHSALSSWLTFSMAQSWMLESMWWGLVDAAVLQWQPLSNPPQKRPDGATPQCPHHQHSSSTRQNVSISCGTVLPCVKIFCCCPLPTAAALSEATITPKIAIQDFGKERLWRKLLKNALKNDPLWEMVYLLIMHLCISVPTSFSGLQQIIF